MTKSKAMTQEEYCLSREEAYVRAGEYLCRVLKTSELVKASQGEMWAMREQLISESWGLA